MHASVDREMCEYDDSRGFVSPHSSHQNGGYVGLACHRNRILIFYRVRRFRVCRNPLTPIFCNRHICELMQIVPAQDRFRRSFRRS